VDVAGPIDVAILAQTDAGPVEIGRTTITDTVPAGQALDAIQLELHDLPPGPYTGLTAVVDPDDAHHECDETNNSGDWTDYLCY
jgi:hypothetical protein